MNFLTIKYRILVFAIGLSIFMLSCEQEIVQLQDDLQVSVEKMVNDIDVVNFIEANLEFTDTLATKIKANEEEFKLYLNEGKYRDIDALLNISEIESLFEDMVIKKEIALNKYPDLIDLYDDVSAKYYLNNSVVVERCGTPGFTSCMNGCGWSWSCYYHCEWWYCSSSGF